MELSTSLVKKFVEVTQETEESTGYYSYGTAIVDGDNKYVQLDGSDSVTSISVATDVATGDRVLIYIEDHTASVIGNITCPASGRTAIDVDERLLDFETLIVGDFQAINAEVEIIAANYVDTEYLTTNYVLTEYLVSNYITADTIASDYATIGSLTALWEYVDTLEASEITVDYLEANYANITDLKAVREKVVELEANQITVDYLDANYASINDLEVVNAYIINLDSDYANIKNLLAGNAGVGDLQAIYLTSDNVVIQNALIEDAAIANVSADKITAGTIYTARVKIQTDENDESLYMDNSLIQMSDESQVRLQAGKDATGLYNFYIWNENGDIMFDALGATADGIGTGVIVNTHVADNANIAGYKLDIASVAEYLNEDGSITVTAAQVSIGNTSLSAWYTEMTSLTTELGNSLTAIETEFTVIQGQIEEAVRQTEILEGEITTISDNYAQIVVDLGTVTTEVSSLTTEYNNLIGEYNSLVSEVASITTNVNNITIEVSSLISGYNSLSSDVASITTSVNNISIDVSSLTTNYGTLSSQVASINTDISSITASVSSVQETLNNLSVGGRNYLLNTRELTAKTGETTIGSSWSYYGLDENGYGVILGDATKASNNYVAFYTDVDATTDVFNNQNMIFSIDLYAPNATSLPKGYAVLFSVYGSNNGTSWSRRLYKMYYLNTTSDGTVINTGDIVDNEWFRLIIKFIPPSTTDESSWSGNGGLSSYSIVKYVAEFGLRSNNTVSDPIYIRKPKLEIGTVATDWSPAPEDNDISEESVVEILKNNITLKTASNTNGTASIVLSVDGEDAGSATEVVTDAREAFENESSSITISAGTITFNSGTLVVNSSNFSLTKDGDITAKSGTIGGLTISNSSLYYLKSSIDEDEDGIYFGRDGIGLGGNNFYDDGAMFKVLMDGTLVADNAYLGDKIYMHYKKSTIDMDESYKEALYITPVHGYYYLASDMPTKFESVTVNSLTVGDDTELINGKLVVDGTSSFYINSSVGYVTIEDIYNALPNYLIQYGTVSVTYKANTYTDVTVTFSTKYSSTPVVVADWIFSTTVVAFSNIAYTIQSRSTSNFVIRTLVNGNYDNVTISYSWIAIGKA